MREAGHRVASHTTKVTDPEHRLQLQKGWDKARATLVSELFLGTTVIPFFPFILGVSLPKLNIRNQSL